MYTFEVYGRNVWLRRTLVCCFEKAQEACVLYLKTHAAETGAKTVSETLLSYYGAFIFRAQSQSPDDATQGTHHAKA
jgi:hypothetical protein